MKSQLKIILSAVKNAFKAYALDFNYSDPCEKLFENFTRAIDSELKDYQIKYDYLCGKDTANVDGKSKGFSLRRGDAVLMDVSVGKNGIWCDVTRTFFAEEVSSEQKRIFDLAARSVNNGAKALKSGATAQEIYRAANSVYVENGKNLIHHAGHKIGKECFIDPSFVESCEEKIEAGDFVAIESGLYGDFGVRLENDYYITENGAEDLFSELMPFIIEEYVLKCKN